MENFRFFLIVLLTITTGIGYCFEELATNFKGEGVIPTSSETLISRLNSNFDIVSRGDLTGEVISFDMTKSGDQIVVLEMIKDKLKLSLFDDKCNILWDRIYPNIHDIAFVKISDNGEKILLSLPGMEELFDFTHILFNKNGEIISSVENSYEMLDLSPSGNMLYGIGIDISSHDAPRTIYYYDNNFEQQNIPGLKLETDELGVFSLINNHLVLLRINGKNNYFELYSFEDENIGKQLVKFPYNEYIDFAYSFINERVVHGGDYIYFSLVHRLFNIRSKVISDLSNISSVTILSDNNSRFSYIKRSKGFESNVTLDDNSNSDDKLYELDVNKIRWGFHKKLAIIDNLIVLEHFVSSSGILVYDTKSEEMFHIEGILKKFDKNHLVFLDNKQLVLFERKENE